MSVGRWFRVYDSVLDDPKVQRLPDNLFRAWINLMCIASRNDGIIPNHIESIAFSLRISVPKANATIAGLRNAELLDDVETGWQPHNWNGRQYKSDVSTERVKRFRERFRNVSQTPHETAPDTESKTETLSLRSSVPAPSKRKNKSSLPENFPDEVSRKWAETLWLQKGRVDLCDAMDDEAAKFRDHHTANNKSSADWAGSWRTWARNAIDFSKANRNGRGNGNGKLSAHQKFAAAGLSIIRDAQRRTGDGDNDPVSETQRPLLET